MWFIATVLLLKAVLVASALVEVLLAIGEELPVAALPSQGYRSFGGLGNADR